jgi:hypothetical protein
MGASFTIHVRAATRAVTTGDETAEPFVTSADPTTDHVSAGRPTARG